MAHTPQGTIRKLDEKKRKKRQPGTKKTVTVTTLYPERWINNC
jgi:hypothetical protein